MSDVAPLNSAELATMFATLADDVPDASTWTTSYAGARRILATILHLESLVYVPGQWRCAKCRFVLQRMTISTTAGQVGVSERDRNQPEPCPNGCGPLWRVSERDAGNEVAQRWIDEREHLSNLLGGIAYYQIPAAVEDLVKRTSLPGTTPICTRCHERAIFPGKRTLASGDMVDCPEITCPTKGTR